MARKADRGAKPAAAAAVPPGAPQVAADAPTPDPVQGPLQEPEPAAPEPVAPELRLATAAPHVDHDLHLYAPGETLALTRPQFDALARSRSIAEASWEACAALPGPAA